MRLGLAHGSRARVREQVDHGVTLTSAEATALNVLTKAQSGASLCIPGTREGGPQPRAATAAEPAPSAAGQGVELSEARRAEYAREGGGAPGERGPKRLNFFQRLWAGA